MKLLNTTPRILHDPIMQRELMEHAVLVNALAEARVAATVNARPMPPVNGGFAHGDFVRNSRPTEQGTAGSKYVVFGWLCVESGEPGRFVPLRCLTGN